MTVSSMKVCEDIVLATDSATLTPSGEDVSGIGYTWAVSNLPNSYSIPDENATSITIPKNTLTAGTTYVASLTTTSPILYVAN